MENSYIQITESLLETYTHIFGVDFSKYTILNDVSNSEAPITYRSAKEIVLNFNPLNDFQFPFQLSHELCHASIPQDVNNSLRWFEELLAVLSSRIFPAKISTVDMAKYIDYFDRSFEICPCVSFPDSSSVLNDNILKELENGSGTRNYNDYGSYWNIAQKILPVIDVSSDIWKCVPYIAEVPSNLPFADSLDKWKELSPLNVGNSISVIKSILLPR